VKCFARHGYHAASVSHIIEEADIARGTFYLYFKSKHDIFKEILDAFISHISAQINLVDMKSETSPLLQMRANIDRTLNAITEKPELAKILFNEAVGLDDETQSRLKEFYGRLISIIRSAIERGVEFGIIREVDSAIAACVALGAIKEVVTQTAILGNLKIAKSNLIDGMMDIFFGGIGSKKL